MESIGSTEIEGNMTVQMMERIRKNIESKFERSFGEVSDFLGCLEISTTLIRELIKVKECVEPCCPPYIHILDIYKDAYIKGLEQYITVWLDEDSLAKEPGKMIEAAKFLDEYCGILESLDTDYNEVSLVGVLF